jgi:hypothetical protein
MAYDAFVRCHEWRGKTGLPNSGFVCRECGQEVEKASQMQSVMCRPRGIAGGSDWFPRDKSGFPILRDGEAIFGGKAANK